MISKRLTPEQFQTTLRNLRENAIQIRIPKEGFFCLELNQDLLDEKEPTLRREIV